MLRIGFVGVGFMGQMGHIRNYQNIPGCEMAAVSDVRIETAEKVATRYGIAKVYSDYREMAEREQLDGVVVCQNFRRHAAMLPELFSRVGHVFTEKPLALRVKSAERVASAANQAGCVCMVGYHKRSDPAVLLAKEQVDEWLNSGNVGKLKYIRITVPEGDWAAGSFVGLINSDEKPLPNGDDLETVPGGMSDVLYKQWLSIVDFYIHDVNLLRYFLGEPYRVTYAEKSGVLMAVESESGVAGAIEMSPYMTTVGWQEEMLVGFEHGYVKVWIPAPLAVDQAGEVEIYEDAKMFERPVVKRPVFEAMGALRRQALNFVEVCKGEMLPPCSADEAVEDVKVCHDYFRLRFGMKGVL